jgi:transcription elongation factor GreB
VTLEDDDGAEQRWRVVGPDEFDLQQNKLSMDSPMARGLLGKRVDDEVAISSPSGQQLYVITAIEYPGA